MTMTTLCFSSIQSLIGFKIEMKGKYFDMDLTERLLARELTEEEVEIAVRKFEAVVVENPPNRRQAGNSGFGSRLYA
jgi:hypothetical protein